MPCSEEHGRKAKAGRASHEELCAILRAKHDRPKASLPCSSEHGASAFKMQSSRCKQLLRVLANGENFMNTSNDVQPERDLSFEPLVNPEPRALTSEQIAFYNEHGYVRPLRIYAEAEAAHLCEYFDGLLAELRRLDDGRDAYAINGYQTTSRGIYDIVTEPRILDYVQDLLGPDFVCWGAHFFCKMPGDPKAVPWHQDASYWPFDQSRTVTVWLAINDADAGNAAMEFIPGTHRLGHLKFNEAKRPAVLNQEIENATQYGQPVVDELEAGEISLHADMLAHGSKPNFSDRQRGGLTIRYCPVEVRSTGGWNTNAVIVRGSDPSGHWQHHERPSGEDLRPSALAELIKAG